MIDHGPLRDTAKYLREVRPIDPEEIQEYLDGQPHPAVVRQALREEAYDLGLRETDEGIFVPVDDEPVPSPRWGPERFPAGHETAVEDLLVDRLGLEWDTGETGDALRDAIRRLKADYFAGNPVEYDETAALGYAIYHLPDYYAAMGYLLESLVERDLLPRSLRVLDVGAGTGGPALALADFLPEDSFLEYHAVEPSASADILEELLANTPRNVRVHVHRDHAETFEPWSVGQVDLLSFCNVLSELSDPVAVVERYRQALADDGTLLAMAPADLETATGLREVERAVAEPNGDLTVYAPTLRLWEDESPADRGWSFEAQPDLAVPSFQRRLADACGDDEDPDAYVKTSVQYAWALLRPDGTRRVDVRASPDRHAKLAEAERHVGNRIDLLAVKLSHDLSEGDNKLFKIGDGSEQVEVYAVLTRPSGLNRDLVDAPYGAIVSVEGGLMLWNDDEQAYNLVIDGESVVDLVAP